MLRKVDHRTARLVSDVVIEQPQPLASRLPTNTGENGKNFT
jgi:uncharacterized protein (DUF342 family)